MVWSNYPRIHNTAEDIFKNFFKQKQVNLKKNTINLWNKVLKDGVKLKKYSRKTRKLKRNHTITKLQYKNSRFINREVSDAI